MNSLERYALGILAGLGLGHRLAHGLRLFTNPLHPLIAMNCTFTHKLAQWLGY